MKFKHMKYIFKHMKYIRIENILYESAYLSTSLNGSLSYRTEEKLGGRKIWRIPQLEFWQRKSLATC